MAEENAQVKETRAARLARLLTRALPDDAERIASGQWGKSGAPYQFRTLEDGRQNLVIEDQTTGTRLGFVGATRDELLDKFEAHLTKGVANG